MQDSAYGAVISYSHDNGDGFNDEAAVHLQFSHLYHSECVTRHCTFKPPNLTLVKLSLLTRFPAFVLLSPSALQISECYFRLARI